MSNSKFINNIKNFPLLSFDTAELISQSNLFFNNSGTFTTLNAYNSLLNFLNDTFISNSLHESDGGGFARLQIGIATFENCKFENNSAVGGAAIWSSDATLEIINSKIFFNRAIRTENGGILSITGGITKIENTEISFNEGGGIISYGGRINLINCTLDSNSVVGNGGGIFSFNSHSILSFIYYLIFLIFSFF